MPKNIVFVDLNEFFDAIKVIHKINSLNLRDVVFVQNGETQVFSSNIYDEFEFTGLANKDFILDHLQDNRKEA